MESDRANELQSEIELLRKVGQGDRRSFEQLYERFSGVLFSIAYRMLKSQEAAEDVLQDVFVRSGSGAADDMGRNSYPQQGNRLDAFRAAALRLA